MIELDDPVTNLRLGLEEYVVMNALEVSTIRHILLLDVDRILSINANGRAIAERIAVWQNLLRKYLTYEKLLAARNKIEVAEESILVREPVVKVGIDASDAKLLAEYGITTILEFLNTDIEETFSPKEHGEETITRLLGHQERLANKELLKQSIEESIFIEYTGVRATRREEPEKIVTPHEFLSEPLSESGINDIECVVLESMDVKTVRDFLDFDIERLKNIKSCGPKVFTRLEAWQKYLRKRLPWEGAV